MTLDVHNLAAFHNAFRCRAENLESAGLLAELSARLAAVEEQATKERWFFGGAVNPRDADLIIADEGEEIVFRGDRFEVVGLLAAGGGAVQVFEALDGSGGVDYLQAQARDNPTAFLTLVGKVLPLQVAGELEDFIRAESLDAAVTRVAALA